PSLSYLPHALACFPRTACSFPTPPLFSLCQATRSSAPYRDPAVLDRAAYSHSASVGNRIPPHSQYPLASSQLTLTTGKSGFADASLRVLPVALANRVYAASVTSVCPSQKPRVMVTSCGGVSLEPAPAVA